MHKKNISYVEISPTSDRIMMRQNPSPANYNNDDGLYCQDKLLKASSSSYLVLA
jgi:hypothetical protein